MKGTLFQKPLEFNLEINGETWNQGNVLAGTLGVTNHGTEEVELNLNGVALALGNIRKVKAKDQAAFDLFETITFPAEKLAPNDKKGLSFKFELPMNGPITDKTQSPYILYGNLEKREGMLQLPVEPSLTFKPLIDVLDIFFRFKVKEKKTAKNAVDFKLIPPDAKEFKALDSLVLKAKELPEQGIELKFQFKLKNLGLNAGAIEVTKTKKDHSLKLTAKDYLLGKDAPNQDAIRKLFQDIFTEVLPKQVF